MSSPPMLTRFRIICHNPPTVTQDAQAPADIQFGLQDKNGMLMTGQPGEDGTLIFAFELNAMRQDDAVVFTGSWVHGTPADRFLYLSTRDTANNAWVRRIKIPLTAVTWALIEMAGGKLIEGAVDGRRTAKVSLLGDGWSVKIIDGD